MNSVESHFDETDEIFYVTVKGDVDLAYMVKGIEMLSSDRFPQKRLRVLEDDREANVNFSISDSRIIAEKFKEIPDKYESIRHAVILKDPKNTAFGLLMSSMLNNGRYNLKVFTTLEAAYRWVKNF